MEPTETFKEKYRAEGFLDGVLAERLQTIGLLGRIAEATDVEGALIAEHERLLHLQAKQLGEQARRNDKPRSSASTGTGATHASTAAPDIGDRVVALMEAARGITPAA